MSETPRDLLARADREKAVASWADSMMCTIRLRSPVKLAEMKQRGPFGRRGKYLYELEDRMPPSAVDALYRALRLVRDQASADASQRRVREARRASRRPAPRKWAEVGARLPCPAPLVSGPT